ncbi:hypothetical protein R6Q59_006506 [Mikania micrantha]
MSLYFNFPQSTFRIQVIKIRSGIRTFQYHCRWNYFQKNNHRAQRGPNFLRHCRDPCQNPIRSSPLALTSPKFLSLPSLHQFTSTIITIKPSFDQENQAISED